MENEFETWQIGNRLREPDSIPIVDRDGCIVTLILPVYFDGERNPEMESERARKIAAAPALWDLVETIATAPADNAEGRLAAYQQFARKLLDVAGQSPEDKAVGRATTTFRSDWDF